jgi:hypothetical protein
VATGDLSRKIDVDVKGEILIKNTINTMVDQLTGFCIEVRVSREWVGGKLAGRLPWKEWWCWKELTIRKWMASNLTGSAEIRRSNNSGAKVTYQENHGDVKERYLELKEPSTRWWIS